MSDGSEFDCKSCKGSGRAAILHRGKKKNIYAICPACFGTGKFDWIENIVGKKITLYSNPNVFIGYQAQMMTTGDYNVCIGYKAGNFS